MLSVPQIAESKFSHIIGMTGLATSRHFLAQPRKWLKRPEPSVPPLRLYFFLLPPFAAATNR
jgi:hypothetical protein